ncbi:LamB/YcsF family protein [Desulfobacula sp.]
MKTIDLNCDMGESFGKYSMGMDDQVMAYITSANIACGWHAGDPLVMDKTVRMAKKYKVMPGAHPGYPDLPGFGRRYMNCTEQEIQHYMVYQIGALQAFCRAHKVKLQHVKPHGALYLTAVEDKKVARAIARAILSVDESLYFVALAGKKGETMRQVGQELGLNVIFEAFPDRAYSKQGTLVPRNEPNAVISDPDKVARRALDMANGFVLAQDGTRIDLDIQTLCVHGDNIGAVNLVKEIRKRLESNGITIASMGAVA